MQQPRLILITENRWSGKPRRTALPYVAERDRFILEARWPPEGNRPAWYANLLRQKWVELEVGNVKLVARAYPASPAEQLDLNRRFSLPSVFGPRPYHMSSAFVILEAGRLLGPRTAPIYRSDGVASGWRGAIPAEIDPLVG